MFSLPFPMGQFPGQLPVNAELKVKNVMFLATATAKKVVKFDMALTTATSFDPYASTSGAGTSAWSMVTNYVVDGATTKYASTDVYAITDAAVSTANTRGDITVMGYVTAIPKNVGSSNHAKGQGFMPSMAGIGNIAPTIESNATLRVSSGNRKIIVLATTGGTGVDTVDGHFNGFGWGWTFFNGGGAGYNIDT